MRDRRRILGRRLIALVLVLFAAFYLVPLAVVVLNSMRSVEDIIQTSIIGWPPRLVLEKFRQRLESLLHCGASAPASGRICGTR